MIKPPPIIEPPVIPTEMLNGKAIHQQLKSQISTLEAEHETYAARIYEAEGGIQQLTAEREDIYLKLARVYLPELTAQSVVDTLKEVQATVRECFNTKQKRRSTLIESLKQNRVRRTQEQAKLDQLTASIEVKAAERAKIETNIAETLRANANYTKARELADASKTPLEQYKTRAKAFSDEAKVKSAAYEAETLFTYLVKRDYNTQQYSAFAITRYFDDRVAAAVNYRDAKKNYDRLIALPKFIETEITRQQAALDKVVTELRRLEDEAARGSGLETVIADGQKLIEQRQIAQKNIAALDAEHTQSSATLQGLDNTKDDFHRQALNQMKSFLRGETLASLKERARATPDTEDDRLVARLEKIDEEISQQKTRAAEFKTQQLATTEQLSKVNRVESWFTKNDFETGRSQFSSGFDVKSLLTGFIVGDIAERVLQAAIQREQYFRPPPSYRTSNDYASASNSANNDSNWGFGGWGSGGGSSSTSDSGSSWSSSSSSSDSSSSSSSSDSFSSSSSTTTDSF